MFNKLFKNWKSDYVSREKIYELTGGMIHHKTLRNLDSEGKGIPGKIRVSAKRVVYPIENVIAWLEERAKKWNPQSAFTLNNGGDHE